jgi:group I intron endonuclease
MKISGIYEIINKVNGKRYYGSSSDIHNRWRRHKRELKKNNHDNLHLQNAWNKYGIDNFKFNIVEEVNIDNLLLVEQKYLDICKNDSNNFYNQNYVVGKPPDYPRKKYFGTENPFYGKHHTKETIEILRETSRKTSLGRKHSEETKKKIGLKHKGKIMSEESKIKMKGPRESISGKNHFMFGRNHTKETIEKISSSLKGKMLGNNNGNFAGNFKFYHNQYGEIISSMLDLSKKYNLNYKSVNNLCRNVIKNHKGWQCLEKV